MIYNKRLKFSSVGKEKVIDIEDTNAPEVNNDEVTMIVNEILAEIEKDKITSKDDTQMIEKHNNMEASSSQTAEEKDLDIKENYKQIKQKNEEIKSEIYSQFLKKKPWNQNRLLTAFDYSTNKMIMSFLQPTTSAPKTVANYKKVEFEVETENVHELYQI